MEEIHLYGAYFISYLQHYLPRYWQQQFFVICSHIGDPKNAFILYFPIVFAWRKREGRQLLMAAVASEWWNLILKWCLRGERPYWWIHEANITGVPIKQFYVTCETGPGSPSGHVMVICAVGLLIVLALTNQLYQPGQTMKILRISTWSIFFVIVFVVSLSRIYIAAHFPHQIFLAFILGNAIGSSMWRDTAERPRRFYFLFSAYLIVFTLLFYRFLSIFTDPAFSIPKAKKWCSNENFIKLDTTPFYAMVRDAGAVLGIGVSQFLGKGIGVSDEYRSVINRTFQALLSIIFGCCLENIPLPSHLPFLFYCLGFLKNTTLVVIVMSFVPFISDRLCGAKPAEKS